MNSQDLAAICSRLPAAAALIEATQEGYAGVLPNGRVVDRREHPEATPIPENRFLGVGKPKPVRSAPAAPFSPLPIRPARGHILNDILVEEWTKAEPPPA